MLVKLLMVVALSLMALAGRVDATGSDTAPPPPLSIPGARVVDLRNSSGGVSRYTTIPSTSLFRTYGGKDISCRYTSPLGGTTSTGATYLPNQVVESDRWIFIEGLPEALGEPNVTDTRVTLGPLSSAVRHFTVFCDTVYHFVGVIDVPSRDPMLDPRLHLSTLYNHLQLVAPVVFRNPVVDRWGGLVTRYQAWLAITPAAWARQRSNASVWRGWTMYLLTRPSALDFQVDFLPDPHRPSPSFHGTVACIAAGSTPAVDVRSVPAMPTLPAQSTPGVNGACRWTPPGPGTVTIRARITFAVTFWVSGYTEHLADYVWSGPPSTFRTGELAAVNTNG